MNRGKIGWLNLLCFATRTARFQAVREVGGYEGLIGNTPMVQLQSLSAATGCEVLVKVSLELSESPDTTAALYREHCCLRYA